MDFNDFGFSLEDSLECFFFFLIFVVSYQRVSVLIKFSTLSCSFALVFPVFRKLLVNILWKKEKKNGTILFNNVHLIICLNMLIVHALKARDWR